MPEFWKQVGEFLGCDMSSSTAGVGLDQAIADSEAIPEGGRIHVKVQVRCTPSDTALQNSTPRCPVRHSLIMAQTEAGYAVWMVLSH